MPGSMPRPQRSQGLAGSRLRRMLVYRLTEFFVASSTNNGGAAADLGGGGGTWATVSNASGADNATYAVWTRPA